jgi:putative heme iron utilization protein
MAEQKNPFHPADDAARAMAADLLRAARHAAVGVLHPQTGAPHVTRIAFGLDGRGHGLTLVSDLALHCRALRADPRASVLIGDPGARGDPLIHPRITLAVRARFIACDDALRPELRAHWLEDHPKSKLYVDFADFHFVVLDLESADLNASFGKAFHLLREDLRLD